jgi:hypothetical protein
VQNILLFRRLFAFNHQAHAAAILAVLSGLVAIAVQSARAGGESAVEP